MDVRNGQVDTASVPPICAAISDAIAASKLPQATIATRLNRSQQQVSLWATRREPKLDDIRRIEDALGLHRGSLLRAAGYVEDVVDFEQAVASLTGLSKRDRKVLLNFYGTLHEPGGDDADASHGLP